MDFNGYQEHVAKLGDFPNLKERGLIYGSLGLTGEAGEFADKIKKYWRNFGITTGDQVELYDATQNKEVLPEFNMKNGLIKELGDVLWYVTALSIQLGTTLEQVAETNVLKLTGRKERGTLKGEGDNR